MVNSVMSDSFKFVVVFLTVHLHEITKYFLVVYCFRVVYHGALVFCVALRRIYIQRKYKW